MRKTKILIKCFLVASILLAVVSCGGGLFDFIPEPNPRSNPNDPYLAIQNIELTVEVNHPDSDRIYINLELPDYMNQGFSEDEIPAFVVVKIKKDSAPSAVYDGLLMAVFSPNDDFASAGTQGSDNGAYQLSFFIDAQVVNDNFGSGMDSARANGKYCASVFWTTEFVEGMDDLRDQIGGNGDFHYNAYWQGPYTEDMHISWEDFNELLTPLYAGNIDDLSGTYNADFSDVSPLKMFNDTGSGYATYTFMYFDYFDYAIIHDANLHLYTSSHADGAKFYIYRINQGWTDATIPVEFGPIISEATSHLPIYESAVYTSGYSGDIVVPAAEYVQSWNDSGNNGLMFAVNGTPSMSFDLLGIGSIYPPYLEVSYSRMIRE